MNILEQQVDFYGLKSLYSIIRGEGWDIKHNRNKKTKKKNRPFSTLSSSRPEKKGSRAEKWVIN